MGRHGLPDSIEDLGLSSRLSGLFPAQVGVGLGILRWVVSWHCLTLDAFLQIKRFSPGVASTLTPFFQQLKA
jgi:hypothetical protein